MILDDGMVSDLVRYSLISSGIIGENSYTIFGKWRFQKVLNKRVPLIVSNVLEKNIYFIMVFAPHFKFLF